MGRHYWLQLYIQVKYMHAPAIEMMNTFKSINILTFMHNGGFNSLTSPTRILDDINLKL